MEIITLWIASGCDRLLSKEKLLSALDFCLLGDP